MLISIGLSLEYFLPSDSWPNGNWLEVALISVGLASLVTAIQRLVYAKKILGDRREV